MGLNNGFLVGFAVGGKIGLRLRDGSDVGLLLVEYAPATIGIKNAIIAVMKTACLIFTILTEYEFRINLGLKLTFTIS